MSRLTDYLLELKGDFGGFNEDELDNIIDVMKMYKFKKVDVSRDAVNFSKDDKGDITIVEISKGKEGKFDKLSMGVKISKRDFITYDKSSDLKDEVETLLNDLLINNV